MIILIAGGTHTGKTAYAQKILEKCHYPCYAYNLTQCIAYGCAYIEIDGEYCL